MAKTVKHEELQSYFGDADHLEESKNKSFAGLIFELLSEREPTAEEAKVFELILNLSIDHGPHTPSAVKTIESAQSGQTISESLAAGILQINDVHGGAIEPAMKYFYQIEKGEHTAESLVAMLSGENKKMPGYGHRIYKDFDPRANLILEEVAAIRYSEEFSRIAYDIQNELFKQTGKNLPINIDGAIAVVLCTFGWEPKLGKAVFLIARTPGLLGHILNNS